LATPSGAAIITQTCDIVLSKTDTLIVAAIAKLDPQEAAEAIAGARPRFVHLSKLDGQFADLDHLATFQKSDLIGIATWDGLPPGDLQAERKFALAVGRRFSRYAFPDEIVPWTEDLRRLMLRASRRVNSPLHPIASLIREFRLQAVSWTDFPTDITLHVIVIPGELPDVGDDPPDASQEVKAFLSVERSASEIAERLAPRSGPRPEGDDRQVLWNAFGDAVASMCFRTTPSEPPARGAVRSIEGIVSSSSEFTMAQWEASERLDLAHLSEPTPLDDSDE
jgi:hypothetical protein